MTRIGKKMRLSRLFPEDGKIMVVPFESLNPMRAWDVTAKGIIAGGADAIMTRPGILRNYYNVVAGKIPIILTVPPDPPYVDLALQWDCAAVKWQYFGPMNQLPMDRLQRFAIKCDEVGMPFYWEPVPMTATRAEKGELILDADILTRAVLGGVSLGADFIKTNYTGNPETFKKVTSASPVPVTVLGGPRNSDDECLKRIKGVMEGGGAGAAFGRNVTTHPNPEKMVKAIMKIVHEDATIEEAKKELK